jgi:hypothetical protein
LLTAFQLLKGITGADRPARLKGRMAEEIPPYRGALADCERVPGAARPGTKPARQDLLALTGKRKRRIAPHRQEPMLVLD